MADIKPVTPPVTPAEPSPPAVENSYDAMSGVFDGLMTPETTPELNDDGSPKVPVETPPADPLRGEPAPPADAGVAPPADPPEVVPPVTQEVDWKAKFEALEAERAAAPAPAPVATPAAPAAPAAPPLYNDTETSFLTEYDKDYPDIIRGEALKRRGEYRALVDHIFTEIVKEYGPLIQRGAAAADTVAETTALSVIQGSHADYDDKMYDEVIDWADGLTGTRRRIAQSIIEEGNPLEVVDLITEFKSATGRKPIVVAGTAQRPRLLLQRPDSRRRPNKRRKR
jgi:hypothetical protein